MKTTFLHDSFGLTNTMYAIIRGIDIHTQRPDLEELKKNTFEKVMSFTNDFIKTHEINIGYQEILEEFNQGDLVPAGQNFVEVMRKREKFPTINTAVDAYNIAVTESFLALGVHDLDKVKGDIIFDFAKQGEEIPAVNMQNAYLTNKGDYVYRDDEKILAWLDVRDTDLAKLSKETKNIIIIVEGNRRSSKEYITKYLTQACEAITKFCGGNYEIFSLVN